jgi:ABC-type dipeptide/oligopeptide/nickel transport system ATPase component
MRRVRGKRIAMILQDPMASLNPLFSIGNQVGEPIRVHEGATARSAWQRAHPAAQVGAHRFARERGCRSIRTRCRAACASASSARSAFRANRGC